MTEKRAAKLEAMKSSHLFHAEAAYTTPQCFKQAELAVGEIFLSKNIIFSKHIFCLIENIYLVKRLLSMINRRGHSIEVVSAHSRALELDDL